MSHIHLLGGKRSGPAIQVTNHSHTHALRDGSRLSPNRNSDPHYHVINGEATSHAVKVARNEILRPLK